MQTPGATRFFGNYAQLRMVCVIRYNADFCYRFAPLFGLKLRSRPGMSPLCRKTAIGSAKRLRWPAIRANTLLSLRAAGHPLASGVLLLSSSKRFIISVLIEISVSSLPIDTDAWAFQASSSSFSLLSLSSYSDCFSSSDSWVLSDSTSADFDSKFVISLRCSASSFATVFCVAPSSAANLPLSLFSCVISPCLTESV